MAIDEERNSQVLNMTSAQASAYGNVILEDTNDSNVKYLVKEIPILNGSQVVDAQVAFDTVYQMQLNKSIFLQDDSVSDKADDIMASEILDMVEFVDYMKDNRGYLETSFLEAVSKL